MYQSGRAGDVAKKRKSPAKSGRVGITDIMMRMRMKTSFHVILTHSPLEILPKNMF